MSTASPSIVVFISGSGTNLQALIDATTSGALPATIALVVSNRRQALGLERAARAGIPTLVAPRRAWQIGDSDRLAYDESLANEVAAYNPDLLVFAGWMHVMSDGFLARFSGKMLNIHPSILPAFPGKSPIADALAYGAKVTGVTVHFVEPGDFDTGPIVLQEPLAILDDESEASLLERIHEVEHRLLPRAAQLFLQGKLQLVGRQVRIGDA